MKKHFRKSISILLAVTIIFSLIFALDFSAAKDENVELVGEEVFMDGDYAVVDTVDETEENPQIIELADNDYAKNKKSAAIVGAQEISEDVVETTENIDSTQAANVQETTVEETTVETTTVAPTTVAPTTKPAPVVGKVCNVTKTSYESNKIDLKWDKVKNATGYAVYYVNKDKHNNYSKIKDVTSNSISVTGLKHTTSYYFKIAAYIVRDNVRYNGSETIKKTATQPGAVTGLWLARSSNVVELRWNKNSLATGYKVYRACAKTNWKYVEYKLKGSGKTTYTDKNIENNREYRYIVKAYRELYGNCIYNSTGVTKRAIGGLCAPNFSMTSQLSRVSLTWNKNKYATGYELFYSTSKNSGYKKFGTTKKTFYNTCRLTNNKTYYFRVRPYKVVGPKTTIYGTYNTYSKKVTNKAYGKNIGNTYIEISIRQQYMWFYINGKEYCSTSVVTGNDDGVHNTPKGAHKIWQRQSPATLVGPGYVSPVTYWLAFTYSGCGIHDASWRSSKEFGGTTYKGNGSHGCVNTPYNKVKQIYKKAYIGLDVVIY